MFDRSIVADLLRFADIRLRNAALPTGLIDLRRAVLVAGQIFGSIVFDLVEIGGGIVEVDALHDKNGDGGEEKNEEYGDEGD